MFSYQDLWEYSKRERIPVYEIAEKVGITATGLKKGLDKGSLSMSYVPYLCHELGITPNDFYDYKIDHRTGELKHPGKPAAVGNESEVSQSVVACLQEQLREKDKQIQRLLDLLAK